MNRTRVNSCTCTRPAKGEGQRELEREKRANKGGGTVAKDAGGGREFVIGVFSDYVQRQY